jgi:hypothetical protein
MEIGSVMNAHRVDSCQAPPRRPFDTLSISLKFSSQKVIGRSSQHPKDDRFGCEPHKKWYRKSPNAGKPAAIGGSGDPTAADGDAFFRTELVVLPPTKGGVGLYRWE